MLLSYFRTSSILIVSIFLSICFSDNILAASLDTYVDFQANNCTIPAGKSTCVSTLYVTTSGGRTFSVTNLNRGITTSNLLTPSNITTIPGTNYPTYTISSNASGDAANYITYGESNNLNLIEGTKVIARAITTAKCASGTFWNGQVCAENTPGTPIITNPTTPKPILELNRTPKYLMKGQSMSLTVKAVNTSTLSYTCVGAGGASIKKVTLNPYQSVYFSSWESLTKEGWSGSYECDFIATGSGGSTVIADKFTIDTTTMEYTGNPILEINNCTIPAGKSSCTASVFLTAAAGKTYSLQNLSRSITTSNFILPSDYTKIAGSEFGKYFKTGSSILGDTANVLKFGTNDLTALDNTNPSIYTATIKAVATASCAVGTLWNGQICVEGDIIPGTSPINFQANNCTIPAGKSMCVSSLFVRAPAGRYFDVSNATRTLTTSNLLNPTNYVTVIGSSSPMYMATTHSTGDAANYLIYGENGLTLREAGVDMAKAVATASCASGTTWNGQICAETKSAEVLSITCSKSTYFLGEAVSCKISGGVGTKNCWQNGTISTDAKECALSGWKADGNALYYAGTVTSSILGTYYLYVKDSVGTLAMTKVTYSGETPPSTQSGTINFQANNCTIASGKNTCASSLYVTAPSGKYYSVSNLSRGITTSNLLTPNNYSLIPGSATYGYSVSTNALGDAANYIGYGESNTLTLLEKDIVVARAIASAKCVSGTSWNGKTCAPSSTDPIACTMEMRMCEDGSAMPRDMKSCSWLPDQCTKEINPNNPINPKDPLPPSRTPTIKIASIGGVELGGYDIAQFSKGPTTPLEVKGTVSPIKKGLSVKVSSNKSDFFMIMPVDANGSWNSGNSPTLEVYKSRIVFEGENILTFSLIEDSTKKTLSQTSIKAYVKFQTGIKPPILCMIAESPDGTKYPCNQPGTGSGKITPITPPKTGTGIRITPENPTLPDCKNTSTAGTHNLTTKCIDPVDVIIVDGFPTTPIEEALDAASRKRIDTIISRTQSRIAAMSATEGIAFIDKSLSRIESLPNKTPKAKLIDTYTVTRLKSLRSLLKSRTNPQEDDYIGLLDTVLSN